MTGIVIFKGKSTPRDDLQHASMSLLSHAPTQYFDYRAGAFYDLPEPEAVHEYGVYWPVPKAKMLELKAFLAQIRDLDPTNMKFALQAPRPRQISGAFKEAIDLGFAGDQLLINCVNILGISLFGTRISSPYLEVGDMSELSDIQNAAQIVPPKPEVWQPCGSGGFVLNSPNQPLAHDEAIGQLKYKAGR